MGIIVLSVSLSDSKIIPNYQMDLNESKIEDRAITTYSLQGLGVGSYHFQISDFIRSSKQRGYNRNKYV